jgi:hypothetical protein
MNPHYKRHRDDEIFDDIRIRVVPRYKTSGLSGDQWRVSAVTELFRKGTLIYSRAYHTIDDATKHLPWLLRTVLEQGNDEIPNWVPQIKKDERLCHQPSCARPATVVYRLKTEFSDDGQFGPVVPQYHEIRRAFCDEHKQRGDCGREDNDDNYEPVEVLP